MKALGWLLTLSLTAVLVAVVVAPLVVRFVVALGGSWAPSWPLRLAAHLGYEAAIWGSGLGCWLIAKRLGWLDRLPHAMTLVLVPPVAETALAFGLGRVPPGLSTVPGIVVQVLVAALTGAALFVTRPVRVTAPDAPSPQSSGESS